MKIKRLLKEGEGASKLTFIVDVFLDSKVTGKMDPSVLEEGLSTLLEHSIEKSVNKRDFGVDGVRVNKA